MMDLDQLNCFNTAWNNAAGLRLHFIRLSMIIIGLFSGFVFRRRDDSKNIFLGSSFHVAETLEAFN